MIVDHEVKEFHDGESRLCSLHMIKVSNDGESRPCSLHMIKFVRVYHSHDVWVQSEFENSDSQCASAQEWSGYNLMAQTRRYEQILTMQRTCCACACCWAVPGTFVVRVCPSLCCEGSSPCIISQGYSCQRGAETVYGVWSESCVRYEGIFLLLSVLSVSEDPVNLSSGQCKHGYRLPRSKVIKESRGMCPRIVLSLRLCGAQLCVADRVIVWCKHMHCQPRFGVVHVS